MAACEIVHTRHRARVLGLPSHAHSCRLDASSLCPSLGPQGGDRMINTYDENGDCVGPARHLNAHGEETFEGFLRDGCRDGRPVRRVAACGGGWSAGRAD